MSKSTLQQPSLTNFHFRQMFDFNKIEAYSMKRSLYEHYSNHFTYYTALKNNYTLTENQKNNVYVPRMDKVLYKKDMKELEKCILKSELKNFNNLSDINRNYCIEHLLDQIYLIAVGQNNMFKAKYDKYIIYRTDLMVEVLKNMGAQENFYYTNGTSRSGFSLYKQSHIHGLHYIHFKIDEYLHSIHVNSNVPSDFRNGVIYSHSYSFLTKESMEDPLVLYDFSLNQSKMLKELYLDTYDKMINEMIKDGISEADARKAFPKP